MHIMEASDTTIFYFVEIHFIINKEEIELSKSLNNIKSFYFDSDVPVLPTAKKLFLMSYEEISELHKYYKCNSINGYNFEIKVLVLVEFATVYLKRLKGKICKWIQK